MSKPGKIATLKRNSVYFVLAITIVLALTLITAIVSHALTVVPADFDLSDITRINGCGIYTEESNVLPARYNLASVQRGSNLNVIPGAEVRGELCFYNVDGNRTTHITLEAVDVPDGWEVVINPSLHEQMILLDGDIISVDEDLYVEPTEVHAEPPGDIPTGMISIVLPNKLGPGVPGYCLARLVEIIICVPESAEAGSNCTVKITAVASWPGQHGAVAIKQTRDFNYLVKVE